MTIYLVRHANALGRSRWARPDELRPLSPRGLTQAEGLVGLLGDRAIERAISSPAVRCHQTLEPLGAHLGLEVESAPELWEGQPLRRARALLDSLVGTTVVLCSHGDLIPDLITDLITDGMDARRRDTKKGSTWVLEAKGKRFVKGRYLPAP